MDAPSPLLRRSAGERAEAWLVTGPLGHLWSIVADVAEFAIRTGRARVSERWRRRTSPRRP